MPTWTNAVSGSWGDPARWTGGIPDVSGTTAAFTNFGAVPARYLIDLGGVARTVGFLELGARSGEGYTLQNGTIVMRGNPGILASGLAGQAGTTTVLSTSVTLQLPSTTQIRVNDTTLLLDCAITGSGHLNIFGNDAGVLQLASANSARTGWTSLFSGTLSLTANNATGSGSFFLNGGTLNLNSTIQEISSLNGDGAITGSSGATLSLLSGSLNGTLSGDFELHKNGLESLYINTTGGYSGQTIINAGTVYLNDSAAFQSSSAVTVNNGATLQLASSLSFDNYMISNLIGNGRVIGAGSGSQSLVLTNGDGHFGGEITDGGGPLSLVKNGNGVLVLTGVGNTFSGGTTINGGTVILGQGILAGSIGSGVVRNEGGVLTVAGGQNTNYYIQLTGSNREAIFNLDTNANVYLSGGFVGIFNINNGVLYTLNSNSLGYNCEVNIGENGKIDVGANNSPSNYVIRSLSGAGIFQNTNNYVSHLVLDQEVNTVFSGTIIDNGIGVVSFTKKGAGVLTISSAQQFHGELRIGEPGVQGGVLALTNSGAIASARTVVVFGNSALDISGISGGSTSVQSLAGFGGAVHLGGKRLEVTDQNAQNHLLTFVGSAGIDAIVITLSENTINNDMTSYTLSKWTSGIDIMTLNGNANANIINGSQFSDILSGFAGNDVIDGLGGGDVISGGDNDDIITYYGSDLPANITGGSGTDTLLILNGTAPTTFNLVTQGFEAARHVLSDDTNNHTWHFVTENYNATWQLLSTDRGNDDGTRLVYSYDRAALTWSIVTDNYNAGGGRIRQDIVNDDNSYRYFFWDLANAQTWTTFDEEYTAAGVRSVQRIQNDNGTSRTFYWDATNTQTWSTFDEEYAVGGARAIQRVVNDDNTIVTQTYDHANANTWSTITDYTNAAGQRIEQRVTNDDNSYVRVFYDPTNVQTWSTQTDTYNTAGVLVSSVQVPD